MKPKLPTLFVPALLVASLTACEATVAERGNLIDPEKLSLIKSGDTKEDVVKALGSPTTIGAFDTDYWYYMGQRTEQESFFDPEVTDRRIVEVDFDVDDHVTAVKLYGKDDAQPIDMLEQATPPQGHQTTLAEEMFGRGGFGANKDKKKKADQ